MASRAQRYRLIGLLSAIILLIVLAWGGYWMHLPGKFPIRYVQFYGKYELVDKKQLQQAVTPFVDHNFFNTSVGQIQNALLAIPAIQYARVKRVWPDTLAINIQERKAMAVWNDSALLDAKGKLFHSTSTQYWQGLPHFAGDKKQIPAMVGMYLQLGKWLKPDKLFVMALTESAFGDWQVKVSPGIWLYLGRIDIASRLKRFVQAYLYLVKSMPSHHIAYVDCRYRQGFAVKWRQT